MTIDPSYIIPTNYSSITPMNMGVAINREITGNGIMPGGFPLNVKWSDYKINGSDRNTNIGYSSYSSAVSFNFSSGINSTKIDFPRSLFIDNTEVPFDVYARVADTGQIMLCKAFSQVFHTVLSMGSTIDFFAPVVPGLSLSQTQFFICNAERAAYVVQDNKAPIGVYNQSVLPSILNLISTPQEFSLSNIIKLPSPYVDDTRVVIFVSSYRTISGATPGDLTPYFKLYDINQDPIAASAMVIDDDYTSNQIVALGGFRFVMGYARVRTAAFIEVCVTAANSPNSNVGFSNGKVFILNNLKHSNGPSSSVTSNLGNISVDTYPNGFIIGASQKSGASPTVQPFNRTGSLTIQQSMLTSSYAPNFPWFEIFANQTTDMGKQSISSLASTTNIWSFW